MKRRIGTVVLFALAFSFFLAAVWQENLLTPYQERLTYLYISNETKIPAEEAYANQKKNAMGKGNGISSTWWTEKETTEVSTPNLGAKVTTPILAVCGRTDLLFPEKPTLDYDQKRSCLLGCRTASVLFGNSKAVGLTIDYNGVPYKVVGVLSGTEEGLVYQAGKEDDLAFDRLTVRSSETISKAILKNKVKEILAPEEILDYELLLLIAQLVMLFIPLTIGLALLILLSEYAKSKHVMLVEKLFWWMLFCSVLLLIIRLTILNLEVPSEFIPSKWSDFNFWTNLWNEKREALSLLWKQQISPVDSLFFIPFEKCVLYGFLAFLCLLHGGALLKKQRRHTDGENSITEYCKTLRKRRGSRQRF